MNVEAYEPPDPNEWVRPVAFSVTGILIVWNIAGWIIDKGWSFEGVFLAVITAAFMLLSFNASAQMRRAAAKAPSARVKRAHRFWTAVLFMCSGWAAYSAHHAYGQIVGPPPALDWTLAGLLALLATAPAIVVLTLAAFFEPFLPWAIETVEAAPKATAAAVLPQPANDRPSRPAVKPAPTRRRSAARRVVGAAAGGAAVLAGGAAAASDLARPPTEQHEPAGRSEDAVATAKILIGQGVTTRNQLLKRVPGLSKYRAEKLLDELSPGWRKAAA